MFDGYDPAQMFSGSFARKLARGSNDQSKVKLQHFEGNVSTKFVERAYKAAQEALKDQFGPGECMSCKFRLPGRLEQEEDYTLASCAGAVLTLVRHNKEECLHGWHMGDTLWALLRSKKYNQSRTWSCVHMSKPKYVRPATQPYCGTKDYDEKMQLFNAKKGRRPICYCGKRGCIAVPKLLTYTDPRTLKDAAEGLSVPVEPDDLVIMGVYPFSCMYVCMYQRKSHPTSSRIPAFQTCVTSCPLFFILLVVNWYQNTVESSFVALNYFASGSVKFQFSSNIRNNLK